MGLASCARPSLGEGEDSSSSSSEGSSEESTDSTGDGDECVEWDEASQPMGLGDVDVQFVDVTIAAGLDYRYYPDAWPPNCDPDGEGTIRPPCKMEVQGGAAAVGDYDDDGWPDLFASRLGGPNLLFRNRGDGTFEEVAAQLGLAQDFDANGATWADVDQDGDLDLYVTSLSDEAGEHFYLFINVGGTFIDEAAERGAALAYSPPHWGMSVGVGDYDRDGWLDLYTTEWWPGSTPAEEQMHTRLLHNRGDEAPGHYEDVTLDAGVSMFMQNPNGLFGFAPAFVDLDEDGWQDLAITSDLGTSRLFWNEGNGTFRDGTYPAGVSLEKNGMGSTIGDLDGDGHLDWYVTAIHSINEQDCGDIECENGGNRFYRSLGPRCFEELAKEWGIDDGFWGWGTVAFDFDNDGDLDIAETNGFRVPHGKPGSNFSDDPSRLWRNDGPGEFVEISEEVGIREPMDGRGMMSFDYDRDGDLDLFAVGGDGPRLYRNDGGNDNAWLVVKARGIATNKAGIGARIELRRDPDSPPQVRELGANTHFLAQQEVAAHFGLGPSDKPVHEIRVVFPASGTQRVLEDVSVEQTIVVDE
jgi:hypothetical protein